MKWFWIPLILLIFHFGLLLHFPRQHFFTVCSGISHISSEVETTPHPLRGPTRAFLYCCRRTTPPSAAAFHSRTRSAVRLAEHKFNHVQSPDNQNTHRLHSYHTHPNTTDVVIVSSTISVPSFFFFRNQTSIRHFIVILFGPRRVIILRGRCPIVRSVGMREGVYNAAKLSIRATPAEKKSGDAGKHKHIRLCVNVLQINTAVLWGRSQLWGEAIKSQNMKER